MKAGARRQRGITLIGFIIVLIVAGFFAYMGMIIGPAYSEYYSVVKAMNKVASEQTPGSSDMDTIRRSLDKQFNIGYVDSVTGREAKLLRDKTGNSITMHYEVKKDFIYNIQFLITFEHTSVLGSKTAGD